MKKAIRKVLALVCCISLILAMVSYRPPEADAVVLEAASVVAAVAAIMTAAGVTYWANSQTDAINYLGGKIDAYLQTLEDPPATYADWLDLHDGGVLFEILNGGIMRFSSAVANKILDFVRWFVSDEDISSGGEVVQAGGIAVDVSESESLGGKYTGSFDSKFVGDNILRLQFDNLKSTASGNNASSYFAVTFTYPSTLAGTITFEVADKQVSGRAYSFEARAYNYNNPSVYSTNDNGNAPSFRLGTLSVPTGRDYNTIEIRISPMYTDTIDGYIDYRIVSNLTANVYTNAITPSANVSVPDTLAGGTEYLVTTSAVIDDGASVDQATEDIFSAITSEGGLSATSEGVEVDPNAPILDAIIDSINTIIDGIAGLPAKIYAGFTQILTDIKTGLADLKTTATGLADSIWSKFTSVLSDIKSYVFQIYSMLYSLPGHIVDGITSSLENLFVPSETFIDSYVATLYGDFDNHFSILSYPFSVLGEFITRASTAGSQEPIFTWGNIVEPFSGQTILAAGSYNLNDSLENQTFAYVHSLYFIVLKGWISFWFVSYLYHWFCDVFKMRESDMDNPNLDEDFV